MPRPSPQQARILYALQGNGGVADLRALAATIETSAQTVRNQLGKLQTHRLVTKMGESTWRIEGPGITFLERSASKVKLDQEKVDDVRYQTIAALEEAPPGEPDSPQRVFDIIWARCGTGLDLESSRAMTLDWAYLYESFGEPAEYVLSNPQVFFDAFRALALKRGLITETDYRNGHPFISVSNVYPHRQSRILEVDAAAIGQLVSFEGEVQMHTDRKSYIVNAAWRCDICGVITYVPGKSGLPEEPKECSLAEGCGKKLGRTTFTFLDSHSETRVEQWLKMAETVYDEAHKPTIMVHFDDAVVERANPEERLYRDSNRLRVVGVVRGKLGKRRREGIIENAHEVYVDASSVELVAQSIVDQAPTQEEMTEIHRLAARDDALDLVAQSVAPEIAGYPLVKKAIALAFFYGNKVHRPGGTATRKNINLLLIGRASLAKSKLLEWVRDFYPKSTMMVGKGSSSVSIFGVAERDELNRGRFNIVMGLLPRAHNGVFCCDELDRHIRTSSLHEGQFQEALESRTVTISKGDARVTFDADCPVLAACNWHDELAPARAQGPKLMSDYLPRELSPTLISRFLMINMDAEARSIDPDVTLDRIDEQLDISSAPSPDAPAAPVPPKLLRAWISHARTAVRPSIKRSQEVRARAHQLFQAYTGIMPASDRLSMTLRQYADIIRLAEASARLHLREAPIMADLAAAMEIVNHMTSEFYGAALGRLDAAGIVPVVSTMPDVAAMSGDASSTLQSDMQAAEQSVAQLDGGNGVPITTIITHLGAFHGLPVERANAAIERLRERGSIYESSDGCLRALGRRR